MSNKLYFSGISDPLSFPEGREEVIHPTEYFIMLAGMWRNSPPYGAKYPWQAFESMTDCEKGITYIPRFELLGNYKD